MIARVDGQRVTRVTTRHRFARRLLSSGTRVALGPWRVLRYLRRSLTTTSVTLLLLSIVTLNIVWGYPWVGLFAASLSLAIVGWITSQLFRPRMRVDLQLPLSVPAGQPCHAKIHLTNLRRTPAMDLRIGFATEPGDDRCGPRSGWLRGSKTPLVRTSGFHTRDLIRPGAHEEFPMSLTFERRGIHSIPLVQIESYFPFHLFRLTQRVPMTTSIAVTPRPIAAVNASLARAMVKTVDDFSAHYLAGESLEYSGSREFESGMAVRRWDFRSWARLGKPIVREYQAPALQSVWLLVDTAVASPSNGADTSVGLERVLSSAAAVIPTWLERRVRLRMFVTSEQPLDERAEPTSGVADGETLLVRLAAAESLDVDAADRRLLRQLEMIDRGPVMLLTSRARLPAAITDGLHGRIVRIDTGESSGGAVHGRLNRRRLRRAGKGVA